MAITIVDPSAVTPGRGPHPAASPFDRRVSEALGVTAFEVYQVELPPRGETEEHDHRDDDVEDVYLILRGSGWVVVDGEQHAVAPGQFVTVSVESLRFVRAGAEGLVIVAVCAKK